MKRHEDGKRTTSIGVEQFDEWKYIYISTYGNAIKERDLREFERERKKEGERGRERTGRERERKRDGTHVKKKIPEKEEKIFP